MFIKKVKIVLTILSLTLFSSFLNAGFLDSFNETVGSFNDAHDSYKNARGSAKDAHNSYKEGKAELPPSIPEEIEFYVAIEKVQQGPFNMEIIEVKIVNKEIDKNTLVWKEGMQKWTKAGEVSDLDSLFKSSPPPLPPPLN
ncbi:MAG: DUF4339 domain-containing protein [bacterium]|nr:DUF4339 domain-containing protein [bacterium]